MTQAAGNGTAGAAVPHLPARPAVLDALPAPARALLDLTAPDVRDPGPGTDWRAVLDLARHHRVVLPLQRGLGKDRFVLPADVARDLRQDVQAAGRRVLRTVRDLVDLACVLDAAGCPFTVFKGPPLARMLHGDVAGRDSGDIDILVREDDLAVAVAAIAAAGYLPGPAAGLVASPRQRARLLRAANDIAFVAPGRTKLELHWRWSRNPWLPPFHGARIFAAGHAVRFADRTIPVPDPVEHFIYLCVHGIRHRWHRLKWLNDIRATLAQPDWTGGDWQAIADRAGELGAARAVTVAALQACWLDGLPLPGPLAAVAAADPACVTLALELTGDMVGQFMPAQGVRARPGLHSAWREVRLGWQVSTDMRARRHAVLSRPLLLPTENDLLMLDLPRPLGWLWPLLRPVLWSVRQARRRA